MSSVTLGRLPSKIRNLFHLYVDISSRIATSEPRALQTYLAKSTPEYQAVNHKILTQSEPYPKSSIFNPADFPYVELELVKNLFDVPLNLELEAEEKLQAIIKAKYGSSESSSIDSTALISDRDNLNKRFTLFQSRILMNFASYYNPLKVPNQYIKSLIWYKRLLSKTPILIFLKKKQRLFSETSVNQQDFHFVSFRDSVRQLRKIYHTDPILERRARNYYCTDLTTTDLLSMAIKTEHLPTLLESDVNSPSFWSSLDNNDKLITHLRKEQRPKVIAMNDKTQKEIKDIHSLPFGKIGQLIKAYSKNPEKIPFDVAFNDLYILGIEENILSDDHFNLLELIEQSETLEVTAVRVDRDKAATKAVTESKSTESKGTYDDLLKVVSKDATKNENHLLHLFRKLGEWGLLKVEENKAKTALYLFK